MDLTKDQKQWLCNHLGHSFDVHNEYYKLKLYAVELTHISQLLLVSESGLLSKFKGKKIEDVKITNEEELREIADLDDPDPRGILEDTSILEDTNENEGQNDTLAGEDMDVESSQVALKTRSQKEAKLLGKSKVPYEKLRPIVFEYFQEEISNRQGPKQEKIKSFIETLPSDVKKNLGKTTVKDMVWRQIKKEKKDRQ